MGNQLTAKNSEHPEKKLLQGWSDWIAVAIAAAVFVGMLLATLSVLLGHAE